jgi:NAD(P)-dependent dehydrogenase (short-subunit alcohol dehydrogenase family)
LGLRKTNIKKRFIDFKLQDKVAIVTVSQMGYGKGVALVLVEEGCHVVCDVWEAISGSALVIDSNL